MKELFRIVKQAFAQWNEDRAARLAAALAYYALFSLPSVLIIAIAVAGRAFGQRQARGEVLRQIEALIGPQASQVVEQMLQNVQRPSGNILSTVVGVVALALAASAFFIHLQQSLNAIWGVERAPGGGIIGTVLQRLLAFLMVMAMGLLLIVLLLLTTVMSQVAPVLEETLPDIVDLAQVGDVVLTFVFSGVLFALVYKVVPDVRITWRSVWYGGLFTGALFTLGKLLLAVYLRRSDVTSAYGAAGSLVLLLVWIYYSAQIFFMGAEVTQVWARRHATRIRPDENAVLAGAASATEDRDRPRPWM